MPFTLLWCGGLQDYEKEHDQQTKKRHNWELQKTLFILCNFDKINHEIYDQ